MTSQGVDWTVDKAGRILPDSNQRVKSHAVQEKIIAIGEFQSKFHSKNRYRTHRFVIHAISVLSVKCTVEFTS